MYLRRADLYIFLELDALLHADHAGADVEAEVWEHGRVLEPGIYIQMFFWVGYKSFVNIT